MSPPALNKRLMLPGDRMELLPQPGALQADLPLPEEHVSPGPRGPVGPG